MAKKVKITKDGPYLISGKLPLYKEIIIGDNHGFSVEWKDGEKYALQEEYALCRCGKSSSKPFCDGTHEAAKFDGKETAKIDRYSDNAHKIGGPEIDLTDREELCFGAGFCHNKKGDVWNLTKGSDIKSAKDLAVWEACNCPSGRLVAWDKKAGKPIEPKLAPSISIIEEPDKGVSGPLWVKGNVEIESSAGKSYEKRNRVCLCRCGVSDNKPFCDGNHVPAGFSDGDPSILSSKRRK